MCCLRTVSAGPCRHTSRACWMTRLPSQTCAIRSATVSLAGLHASKVALQPRKGNELAARQHHRSACSHKQPGLSCERFLLIGFTALHFFGSCGGGVVTKITGCSAGQNPARNEQGRQFRYWQQVKASNNQLHPECSCGSCVYPGVGLQTSGPFYIYAKKTTLHWLARKPSAGAVEHCGLLNRQKAESFTCVQGTVRGLPSQRVRIRRYVGAPGCI